MGTPKPKTELQLKLAQAALDRRAQTLKTAGVTEEKLADDPQWRRLSARVRQINGRLGKINSLESLNAEVAQRKSEKQAAAEAE